MPPQKTTMSPRSDQTVNPTCGQADAVMRLLAPREGTNMRTKAIHDRLDRTGRARDDALADDIAERAAIEQAKPPVDPDDPPARVPVYAETGPDETHGGSNGRER